MGGLKVVNQTTPPNPFTNLPQLRPPDRDLTSIANVIKDMRQHVLALSTLTPVARLPYSNINPPYQSPAQPEARWMEHARDTNVVKIISSEDPTQFMYTKHTEKQHMVDTITGEQWVYRHSAITPRRAK